MRFSRLFLDVGIMFLVTMFLLFFSVSADVDKSHFGMKFDLLYGCRVKLHDLTKIISIPLNNRGNFSSSRDLAYEHQLRPNFAINFLKGRDTIFRFRFLNTSTMMKYEHSHLELDKVFKKTSGYYFVNIFCRDKICQDKHCTMKYFYSTHCVQLKFYLFFVFVFC